MKRILILGDINSAHTKKWLAVLKQHNYTLAVFSLSIPESDWYLKEEITLLSENAFENRKFHAKQSQKIAYLKQRKSLKKAIAKWKPDVLHAHYASSYAFLGALSKFHPFYVSVWGSDVLLFPSNPINKKILKYNFKKADKIIVSSKTLETASRKFTNKRINIIPFGINTELFKPKETKEDKEEIVIGTVKSLEEVYGIDTLICAFHLVRTKMPKKNLVLKIVGEGTKETVLKQLAIDTREENNIQFFPRVSQKELVPFYQSFDIAVFLSRSESFGVSILEASSCETAVVVSAVGGLMEVVDNKKTGFFVPANDIDAAAERIIELIKDKELRHKMGVAGREKVIKEYDIKDTVNDILNIYKEEAKCE